MKKDFGIQGSHSDEIEGKLKAFLAELSLFNHD
jgi:hypothetical protein